MNAGARGKFWGLVVFRLNLLWLGFLGKSIGSRMGEDDILSAVAFENQKAGTSVGLGDLLDH